MTPDYEVLTNSAAWIDHSTRGRLCLLGADRANFLHGQVTNNVRDLRPGQGCYAALANNKGKMTSDLNIYVLENEILLDLEPGLSARVVDRLNKFIIADDVQVVDASQGFDLITVLGPQAPQLCRDLGFPAPPDPIQIVFFETSYVATTTRFGIPAVDIFFPRTENILERLQSVPRCSPEALDLVRIENGAPRFGVDMDENTLVPEAIEHAISYNKGCYIGQEVIARIRTYGQVAKALRGLRFEQGALAPKAGDRIMHDLKDVGWITSAALSPKLQRPIALGYVRKECNQLGRRLTVNGSPAEVAPLPFQA